MPRLLRPLAAGAVASVAAMLPVTAASAAPVPFTDTSAHGAITLCDVRGEVATSGDVRTKPFVWRAVGSTAAPSGYDGTGRTAALYAFQPVQGVGPERWVGDFLTASAVYSNATRPMAGATASDPSLADLLSSYPTKWDGLVQLRIYLGAPGVPTYTDSYDAATVRVTGARWQLVDGGSSGCDTGSTRSSELVLPEVRKLGTPAPNATTDAPSPRRAASGSSAKSSPSPAPGSSSGRAATGAAATPASSGVADAPRAATVADRKQQDGGGSGWMWAVVAAVALAAAGVYVAVRRRTAR